MGEKKRERKRETGSVCNVFLCLLLLHRHSTDFNCILFFKNVCSSSRPGNEHQLFEGSNLDTIIFSGNNIQRPSASQTAAADVQ